MELTGSRYPNTKVGILHNRKILHLEANGNCCWAFFKNPHFRGSKETIGIGFRGNLLSRTPNSIKQISCNEVKNK